MTRVLFGALAVVDAVLLLSLVATYGWFNLTFPNISESIASIVIIPLLWGITIADRVFAATLFVAIGAGIWKDLAGRDRPRWLAILTTPVLVITLAAIGFTWITIVTGIVSTPPGFIHDRLTLFDALAMPTRVGDIAMLGVVSYASQSSGRFLVYLLAVAYLVEKYLVQSWRVRWPVPILPLIAIGWVGWTVYDGERRLRDFVAQYEWRPMAPQTSWLDAVAACDSLGEGWRLPRREELTRYLATYRAEVQSWEGTAWTGTITEGGDTAIAVDLKPRKSGRWNKGSEPTRDESLCESRTQPGYASDWVAALRPEVCARTTQSQYLFTPGLAPTVLQRGNISVSQLSAAAICVRAPADAPPIPTRHRRGYRDEQEFASAADFRRDMTAKCGSTPERNRAACFAFAPDLPPFEEGDDERLLRAFCELAHNGEGCHRYALLMDQHPDAAGRALRYRELACQRGYAPACR